MDGLGFIIGLVGVFVWWVVSVIICFQKGKPVMAYVGLVCWPVACVGAIRIARPDSDYAEKNYPPDSRWMRTALERFPEGGDDDLR